MKRYLFFLPLVILPFTLASQEKDTLVKPDRFNVIKFNPTPMVLWDNIRNVTLSYERSVGQNHSMSLQAGYLDFLTVFGDTLEHHLISNNKSRFGVNLALDYRFYPMVANKFKAPRGLYIGPYLSYYGFKFTNYLTLFRDDTTHAGTFTSAYNYFNLGFELGYQFIFWKHFSLDLVLLGPSVTCSFKGLNFDGPYTDQEKDQALASLKEKIKEKYPYFSPSIDVDRNEQSVSVRMLLRYSISIGYKF